MVIVLIIHASRTQEYQIFVLIIDSTCAVCAIDIILFYFIF